MPIAPFASENRRLPLLPPARPRSVAAEFAIDELVTSNSVLGLGSGDMMSHAIHHLGKRIADGRLQARPPPLIPRPLDLIAHPRPVYTPFMSSCSVRPCLHEMRPVRPLACAARFLHCRGWWRSRPAVPRRTKPRSPECR